MNFRFLVLYSWSSLFCFAVEREKGTYSLRLLWVPPACSTAEKNIFGYSTRNRKIKRLEPHFQTSATRSAPKEDTKSAVALAHPRECTKELIAGLPKFGSMKTFGARAEKRRVLVKKTTADVLPLSMLSGLLAISVFFCGSCNTGGLQKNTFA